jgi:ABC-type phosphate transport system substrate-binding protein
VFDLQTLADIWMGRITRWNHANITRLNPVNVTLPDHDIVVAYTATDAVQTLLFTSALSASVPAFATQVPTPLPRRTPHTTRYSPDSLSQFGAVAQLNLTGLSGSLVTDADEMARKIASTPYSFTMWRCASPISSPGLGAG